MRQTAALSITVLGLPPCLVAFQPLFCHEYSSSLEIYTRSLQPGLLLYAASSNNDDSLDAIISDEETLLACRVYLQKRNRLGAWTEAKKRKELKRQASDVDDDDPTGYFWEDPTELVYWQKTEEDINRTFASDMEDVEEEEEEDMDDVDMNEPRINIQSMDTDTQDDEETWGEASVAGFMGYELVPPESSQRRSDAAKRKWKDPKWKAMWYEKRWGSRPYRISEELDKQKKLDERIQSLPRDILSSPELANMSNEEISEAVRAYVAANRKRSQSHKRRAQQSTIDRDTTIKSIIEEETTKTPRLDPFSPDAMKEAQRKRSERAAKAYQKRLANQQQSSKQPSTKKTRSRLPKALTPRDALIRIEAALDKGRLPAMEDVELVIVPPKLGRRKELFRRILSEHFGLRGKCVPVDLEENEDSSPRMFVTQCNVEKLGAFVILKMKEKSE